jgi:hypothetical protein
MFTIGLVRYLLFFGISIFSYHPIFI